MFTNRSHSQNSGKKCCTTGMETVAHQKKKLIHMYTKNTATRDLLGEICLLILVFLHPLWK
jgi:hypothetical protein